MQIRYLPSQTDPDWEPDKKDPTTLIIVETSGNPGQVFLEFYDADGREYSVHLPRPVAISLAIGLQAAIEGRDLDLQKYHNTPTTVETRNATAR